MSILHSWSTTAPLAISFRTAAAQASAPSARPGPVVFLTVCPLRPDCPGWWAQRSLMVFEHFGKRALAGASLETGER